MFHTSAGGRWIQGTVGDRPAPLRAVSPGQCLLTSPAIGPAGDGWAVLPAPAWRVPRYSQTSAAVALVALLRVSPRDIGYISPRLIPLIIWAAPGMMNRWD